MADALVHEEREEDRKADGMTLVNDIMETLESGAVKCGGRGGQEKVAERN